MSFGFTDVDVSVYMFLFTKKLFDDQSQFNSYRISQELTKLSSEHMLEDDRSNFGSKAVAQSLNKIEGKGFVIKLNEINKTNLRGKTPNSEYQAKDISEVREIIRKNLDEITKKKLNTLSNLEDIEENVKELYDKGEKMN